MEDSIVDSIHKIRNHLLFLLAPQSEVPSSSIFYIEHTIKHCPEAEYGPCRYDALTLAFICCCCDYFVQPGRGKFELLATSSRLDSFQVYCVTMSFVLVINNILICSDNPFNSKTVFYFKPIKFKYIKVNSEL